MITHEKRQAIDEAGETQKAISALYKARDDARIAVLRGTDQAAERAIPGMKAALLTAQKRFGTPAVQLDDSMPPVTALELQRRLLERILPMLDAGHYDEAREEARAYLDKMGA